MFDNIGGKIKGLAKVVFIIEIIATVICGIAVLALNVGILSLLLGLLCIAVGVLVSWLSVLLIYAFGQLVENSDNVVRLMEDKNLNAMSNDISKETPLSPTSEPKENKPAPLPTWKPVDEAEATYVGETNVKCNNCDCVQFKGNKKCARCGAKFVSYQK